MGGMRGLGFGFGFGFGRGLHEVANPFLMSGS